MAARIGVIGTGWWATEAHLPAIVANPDCELVAIADPIDEKRDRAASVFEPAASYADHREMLDDEQLDGVVIAVPHTAHFDVAMDALRAGCHMMLEKPMVVESRHATTLLEESAKRNLEIVVGYPWHYNQQVLAAREWISNGEVGELLYVHSLFASIVWDLFRGDAGLVADTASAGFTVTPTGTDTYGDPALSGGGQAIVQITHSAALLLFMTGLKPTDVFAFMENRDLRVDLVDALTVRFEGGCVGTIGSTGSSVRTQEELLEFRLYGVEGHIFFDLTTSELTLFRADGSVERNPDGAGTSGSTMYSSDYPVDAPVNNLVDVILGRDENRSPAPLAAEVVRLLEAAYESARTGQRQTVLGS